MRKILIFGEYGGKPLEWFVVDESDTYLTLWCRSTVATLPYAQGFSPYYDESSVRDFLENEFYEKAFSPEEKEKILQTELDLSENQTYYGAFNGGATAYRRPNISARAYLLSPREMIKTYALTEEEIFRADAEKLWTRSPFSLQTVSLVNCEKEIFDGKSPYFYVSESYNPRTDEIVSSNVPFSAYPNREHGVVPAVRIMRSAFKDTTQ